MPTDYNDWRKSHGLRPVTGARHAHTLQLSNIVWSDLLTIASSFGCNHKGKPSVAHMLELISDGTLRVERTNNSP